MEENKKQEEIFDGDLAIYDLKNSIGKALQDSHLPISVLKMIIKEFYDQAVSSEEAIIVEKLQARGPEGPAETVEKVIFNKETGETTREITEE